MRCFSLLLVCIALFLTEVKASFEDEYDPREHGYKELGPTFKKATVVKFPHHKYGSRLWTSAEKPLTTRAYYDGGLGLELIDPNVDPFRTQHILCVGGKSDYIEANSHILYYLADFFKGPRKPNVRVWSADLIGQGGSSGSVKCYGKGCCHRKTHCEHSGDYVDGLFCILSEIYRSTGKKITVLVHSLAGHVYTQLIRTYPRKIRKWVNHAFNVTPMIEFNTRPFPKIIADSVCRAMNFGSLRRGYAIGQKPIHPDEYPFLTKQAEKIARENPDKCTGGATPHWVVELTDSCVEVQNGTYINPPPMDVFWCTYDSRVLNPPIVNLYESMENCSLRELPYRHYAFLESKESFHSILDPITDFLEENNRLFFEKLPFNLGLHYLSRRLPSFILAIFQKHYGVGFEKHCSALGVRYLLLAHSYWKSHSSLD